MARGAQKAAEDMSKSGYNSAQQFNTNLTQGNQQIQSYLLPQYQNLIQNPGYDSATKSAITQAGQGAAASSYASASDALARRAARTNNSAGEVAGMDKLAQEKAQTMAGTAANEQIAFANRSKADVTEGLQGISGLYGMDTNLLSRALGIPPEYLQQYNNGRNGQQQPTAGSFLLNAAQGAIGGAAGAIGI